MGPRERGVMAVEVMFEQVREFFRAMQNEGFLIEIRSFEQVRGTNPDRVGFTVRGMCVRDDRNPQQPLMLGGPDDDEDERDRLEHLDREGQ